MGRLHQDPPECARRSADIDALAESVLANGTCASLRPEALGLYLTATGGDPDRSAVAVAVFERVMRRDCARPYAFASCLRRCTDRAHVPAGFAEARSVLRSWAFAFQALARADGTQAALGSVDAAVALAFSAVMLSHNLHQSGVGSRRVDRDRFVEGCRALDDASDVPDAVSGVLYDDVAAKPLAACVPDSLSTARMEDLDAQPVAKQGWLMVKEVDGAAADVSWHRRWMRVCEHHAAMFLTPQQWGLDGEIVLALPLQGLVVANVEGHSKLVGEQSQHGQVAEPFSPASRKESAVQTARNGQVQGAVSTPLSLSPCADRGDGTDDGAGCNEDAYGQASFMLLVGSSDMRKDFPRLLLSAGGNREVSREWAEAIIQRVQMSQFKLNLQQALQTESPVDSTEGCETGSKAVPATRPKRPKAWGRAWDAKRAASRVVIAPNVVKQSLRPSLTGAASQLNPSQNSALVIGGSTPDESKLTPRASEALGPQILAWTRETSSVGAGTSSWVHEVRTQLETAASSASWLQMLDSRLIGGTGDGAVAEGLRVEGFRPYSNESSEPSLAVRAEDAPDAASQEISTQQTSPASVVSRGPWSEQGPRDAHTANMIVEATSTGTSQEQPLRPDTRESDGDGTRTCSQLPHVAPGPKASTTDSPAAVSPQRADDADGMRVHDTPPHPDADADVDAGRDDSTRVKRGLCTAAVRSGLRDALADAVGQCSSEAEGANEEVGGEAGQRVQALEALVRFREWEAKCMRQDLKLALNSSLWNSVNGPLLDAVCQHVRARHRAHFLALLGRLRVRRVRRCFDRWSTATLACRRRRLGRARAEQKMRRHMLGLLRTYLRVWHGALHCKVAASASRMAAPDTGGGCFRGLFRCLGSSGRGAGHGKNAKNGMRKEELAALSPHSGSEQRTLAAQDPLRPGQRQGQYSV